MKNWYAASVILLFEYEDGNQNDFPVWESVYLIEACSDESALKKAIQYGKADEGNSDNTLTVNGRPAKMVFKGVRKLLSVVHSERTAARQEMSHRISIC